MLGCMRIRQGGLRCFSKSSIVPALAGDQPHFFQGRCRSQFFWSLWSPKKNWISLETTSNMFISTKKKVWNFCTRAQKVLWTSLNMVKPVCRRLLVVTNFPRFGKFAPIESGPAVHQNPMDYDTKIPCPYPDQKCPSWKRWKNPFFWGNSSQKYGWTSNNHWNPQTKIGWLPIEIHMLCVCVFSTSPNWKIPSQSTNLIQPKVEVNSLTARLEDRLSHPTERWVWAGNPVIKPHDTTICKGQDL